MDLPATLDWRIVARWATCIALAAGTGCKHSATESITSEGPISAAEEAQITTFCAQCHQPPHPEYFARDHWPHEVFRGYRFYEEALVKAHPSPPPVKRTVQYFSERSPQEIARPETIQFVAESTRRFRPRTEPVRPVVTPAVAALSWQNWTGAGAGQVVFADMGSGVVAAWDPATNAYRQLARIPHPAGLEWCDLNRDGLLDLVVSDLGSFEPQDHTLGEVVWLAQQPNGEFKRTTLATGLGRVCETRAADFTEDGLLDLIVAEFGWHKTGAIKLLIQSRTEEGRLQFQQRAVDPRHGTIRVPPLDLNGDGAMDFVALISQEHEAIEAFINRGNGRFDPRPLCVPADPAFGSNGLEPVDLDGDGDIDFVVTNGDMFDNFNIKPYHGVRWLENRGNLQFIEHHLLTMPGVHGTSAADIDLDGDLDIVTAACFPARTFAQLSESERATCPSAIWLEQTAPGEFQPHPLEFGQPFHATHLLADIDDDGDVDLLLGQYASGSTEMEPPITVFENLTRSSDAPSP